MRFFLLFISRLGGMQGPAAQESFSWQKVHETFGQTIINGQSGVDGRLDITHLGAALDHYYLRTIPVYVELQRALGEKPRHFFAYAGAGLNLAWPTSDQRNTGGWGIVSPVAYKPGLYSQMGIGRTLGKVTGRGFILRLGHSAKSFTESYTERVWRGTEWTEASRSNRYLLGRLDIT
ncbi:MAG: hypothetical protein EBZ67_16970, partial [Chitinophagia bacterium]|nr:hypothetical protein [Chitinophagia bacterium]